MSTLSILFFSLFLFLIFYFERASCKWNLTNNNVRLVKISKSSPGYYVNNSNNATQLVESKFEFPTITLLNESVQSLNADIHTFSHHTGYYPIQHSYGGARLFYLFFESRSSKSDPVLLWLTGGPGGGFLPEVFLGNGPFRIDDDLSLKWNDFGWDKVSNLLYVDQPIGAGFSHTSDRRDIRQTTNEIVDDIYGFLKTFFQAHTEFMENDFYIAGSSHAGHTIPALASRVQKANKAKEDIHINIKGFAIGSGYVNPEYIFSSLPDFAFMNKLISESRYNVLKKYNPKCITLIQQCQNEDNICMETHEVCNFILAKMFPIGEEINLHDFRIKDPENLPFDGIERVVEFMNLDSVRKALNVGSMKYEYLNVDIHNALSKDCMKNYAEDIPLLLEDGMKVLIFHGEYDFICNWLANLRLMDDMKWIGRDQFLKTKFTPYIVDGKKVGLVKSAKPLTFIKVHNTGHNVTRHRHDVALHILEHWING